MSAHHGSNEHAVHVPQPSISPPILGLGVLLISFGVIVGIPIIVVGVVILVAGIATWLIDDARAYVSAGEPTEATHH